MRPLLLLAFLLLLPGTARAELSDEWHMSCPRGEFWDRVLFAKDCFPTRPSARAYDEAQNDEEEGSSCIGRRKDDPVEAHIIAGSAGQARRQGRNLTLHVAGEDIHFEDCWVGGPDFRAFSLADILTIKQPGLGRTLRFFLVKRWYYEGPTETWLIERDSGQFIWLLMSPRFSHDGARFIALNQRSDMSGFLDDDSSIMIGEWQGERHAWVPVFFARTDPIDYCSPRWTGNAHLTLKGSTDLSGRCHYGVDNMTGEGFRAGLSLENGKWVLVNRPGFDCAKAAMPTDYVICSDSELRETNEDMVEAWRAALREGGADRRDALFDEQRAWMHALGPSCGLPGRGKPGPDLIGRAQDCVRDGLVARTLALQAIVAPPDDGRGPRPETEVECGGVRSVVRSRCDSPYNCSQLWHVSGKQHELAVGGFIAQGWACLSVNGQERVLFRSGNGGTCADCERTTAWSPRGSQPTWHFDSAQAASNRFGKIEFHPICARPGSGSACE